MSGKIFSRAAPPAATVDGPSDPASALAPRLKPVSVPAYLAGTGAGIVLLLALFQPVISGGLNLPERVLFFALHMGPALALAWVLSGWLFGLRAARGVPPWLLLVLAGLATGLVLAPWSVLLEALFGVVEPDEQVGAAAAGAGFVVELRQELLVVPPKAAAIWLAVNLAISWRLHVNTGGTEMAAPAVAARSPGPQAPAASLLARIPARLGRDVVYLEAQEHYLRVVLTGGEHLVLHGLSNAVRELEAGGAAGMQVHRSYWVNWAHVQRVDIDSGGGYCELAGGVRIPVSRRRAAAARTAYHEYPRAAGADTPEAPPASRGSAAARER